MTRLTHLSVVVPGALTQLQHISAVQLRALAGMHDLQYGGALQQAWSTTDKNYARLDPWQMALLCLLDPAHRSDALASAALSWLGEGGIGHQGTYLHLEPVHFMAGLHSVQMSAAANLGAAATAIAMEVRALLLLAGFELHCARSGQWYAWSPATLDLLTYSPRAHTQDRLDALMPQGADGPQLRRLITELQMLLHQQSWNTADALADVTLNGLWPWGAGGLDLVSVPLTQRILGRHVYVRGLCLHLQQVHTDVPTDAPSLLAQDTARAIMVFDACDNAVALQQWDALWLRPLISAVQQGVLQQLCICLDHWTIVLQGNNKFMSGSLRRIFKQPRFQLQELLR